MTHEDFESECLSLVRRWLTRWTAQDRVALRIDLEGEHPDTEVVVRVSGLRRPMELRYALWQQPLVQDAGGSPDHAAVFITTWSDEEISAARSRESGSGACD